MQTVSTSIKKTPFQIIFFITKTEDDTSFDKPFVKFIFAPVTDEILHSLFQTSDPSALTDTIHSPCHLQATR